MIPYLGGGGAISELLTNSNILGLEQYKNENVTSFSKDFDSCRNAWSHLKFHYPKQ